MGGFREKRCPRLIVYDWREQAHGIPVNLTMSYDIGEEGMTLLRETYDIINALMLIL